MTHSRDWLPVWLLAGPHTPKCTFFIFRPVSLGSFIQCSWGSKRVEEEAARPPRPRLGPPTSSILLHNLLFKAGHKTSRFKGVEKRLCLLMGEQRGMKTEERGIWDQFLQPLTVRENLTQTREMLC